MPISKIPIFSANADLVRLKKWHWALSSCVIWFESSSPAASPSTLLLPRIAMLVNCGMDFFEEIAKMRATRRLYAKMMRDEFGAQSPRSMSVAITSHTSGLSLTAQQPVNNIVRGAIQALSLVLGGVQALEISAFDEAYRTPSKDAHIVGLRTQQIIDLETGAGKVVDPLGGSYSRRVADRSDRVQDPCAHR